ncbi:MAG: ComEC/Rec2 family competence protein [Spirochaetales bacterium]|nr:ComEC/Rec2 family competence protein [Spirochaetales bacterium]
MPVLISKLALLALSLLAFQAGEPFHNLILLLGFSLAVLFLSLCFPWRRFLYVWPFFLGLVAYHEEPYRARDYLHPLPVERYGAILYRARVQKMYGEKVALVDLKPLAREKRFFPKRIRGSKRRRPLFQRVSTLDLPAVRDTIVLSGFSLRAGCEISFRLYGRSVPEPLGDSSFHQYLRSRGAKTFIRIHHSFLLEESCPPPDLRDRLLAGLKNMLAQKLSRDAAAIATGMLTGNYRLLDPQLREQARASGVLHLFAASGLHAGIVYGLFFFPMAMLMGRRRPLVLCLGLIPPLFYLYLLSFPLSLLRAFSFLLLYSFSVIQGRPFSRAHLLAGSALLCFAFEPRSFVSAGAALSFAAVTGILYFYKPVFELWKVRSSILRICWAQCALSISAGLFTLPVLALLFGKVGQSGLYFNSVLVPLTSLALPLLVIALLLEILAVELSLADGLLSPLWEILDWLFLIFVKFLDAGIAYNVENTEVYQIVIPGLLLAAVLPFCRRGRIKLLAGFLIFYQYARLSLPAQELLARLGPLVPVPL